MGKCKICKYETNKTVLFNKKEFFYCEACQDKYGKRLEEKMKNPQKVM